MKRDIFKQLITHLDRDQISLIVGARQVGKTTILNQLTDYLNLNKKPNHFISLEDKDILALLNEHPKNLLQLVPILNETKSYILIDEIQYLNDPSNFLKLIYDLYKNRIKLIVTGSSSFYIDRKFRDSLAGRKRIFNMYTLSFEEMLRFKGFEQYIQYLNTGNFPKLYNMEIKALINEYMLYGGYPQVVLASNIEEKKLYLEDIAESYVKKDAVEAGLHKTDNYLKILRILSRQPGALLNYTNIGNDLKITSVTMQKYIHVMRKSFHIGIITPFFTNITKELTKMPKLYFNDLGLLNYFRHQFIPIPINKDRGVLFENFVYRRLLDFHGEKNITFWRTQQKQEVDFIINSDDGTQQAYEVKYSEKLFNENKYLFFKKTYPEISLKLIHFDNVYNLNF